MSIVNKLLKRIAPVALGGIIVVLGLIALKPIIASVIVGLCVLIVLAVLLKIML